MRNNRILLSEIIGEEAARKLGNFYAGERIYIPKPSKKKEIIHLYEKNYGIDRISKTLKISKAHIYRTLRQSKK